MEQDSPQLEEKYLVPEERVLEQRTIIFLEDELIVALGENSLIYCSLPGMCSALGLHTQPQSNRILRTKLLRPGLMYMRLKTPKRGSQKMYCLRIDLIASWLSGAETEAMRPGAAEKVDEYQSRLAPIATQVFLNTLGFHSPTAILPVPQRQTIAPTEADGLFQQMTELREQYQDLSDIVNLMRESMEAMMGELGGKLDDATALMQQLVNLQQHQQQHIERLEAKTQGLTKDQKAQISHVVGIIVKDSARVGAPITYAEIFGSLKRQFHVSSYEDIPDDQFNAVMDYLRGIWQRATQNKLPKQETLFEL